MSRTGTLNRLSPRVNRSPLLILVIALLWSNGELWAHNRVDAADTLRATVTDTTAALPTRSSFIPEIGSTRQTDSGPAGLGADSTSELHSLRFIWTDARYVGDILWKIPGMFVREMGEPGQPVQLNALGGDQRGIAIQLDGRPLNDPVFGGFPLYDLPLEFVERVEVEQGALSSSACRDAASAALNFVTHQYNTVRPITKIRFVQGPYEQILTDGLYTQNVARGVNVMAGFQRLVTDGRFTNSKHDGWTIRSRVRVNVSDRFNVWASDLYNKSTTGLNGGIDLERSPSIYNEVTAIVKHAQSGQSAFRHDLTLGAVARLLVDSTSMTRAILYYTTAEREYRVLDQALRSVLSSNLHDYSYWGGRFEQRLGFGPARAFAGIDFEQVTVSSSGSLAAPVERYASLRGQLDMPTAGFLHVTAGARLDRVREETVLSWNVRASLTATEWLSLHAGLARTNRFPTIQELFWADSMLTRANPLTKEIHETREIGARFRFGSLVNMGVTFFSRTISDGIVSLPIPTESTFPAVSLSNAPEITATGAAGDLGLRIWKLEATGTAMYLEYTQGGESRKLFPRLSALGEIAYRDTFLNGALSSRLGSRIRYMGSHRGLQFIPPTFLYAEQSSVMFGQYATVDLFLVARIGDAYINLVWENPFGIQYTITAVYPMPARNIKLGINWVFID